MKIFFKAFRMTWQKIKALATDFKAEHYKIISNIENFKKRLIKYAYIF